jgi:hypothetical protein
LEPLRSAAAGRLRALTLEPQLVDDAEIAASSVFGPNHRDDVRIARFNAESLDRRRGLPQDRRFGRKRTNWPNQRKFQNTVSIVAPTRAPPPAKRR